MTEKNFSNLTGKVLIASPFAMEGNLFHQSLIYIAKHTNEGSVGLIFNHTVTNAAANALFDKIDINAAGLNLNVHLGGPVEMARGFFLHTTEYDKDTLFKSDGHSLAVSSNPEIIKDIAGGSGPQDSIFIIGYTGWNAGQLEFELEHNLWIVSEPDHDLIFQTNPKEKWNKALGKLGISPKDFVDLNAASC